MRKTTEALHTDVVGNGNVQELHGTRIVALKGEKFFEYMSTVVLARRFDTAQMVLAQALRNDDGSRPTADLVRQAYEIADELLLQERATLDRIIERYWELYLTRDSKTEDVMRTLVEESKDYSL